MLVAARNYPCNWNIIQAPVTCGASSFVCERTAGTH
jgi:hypothetical protein